MGHLLSKQKRVGRSRYASLIKALVAGCLALCGTFAHAGLITLSSSQAGGTVTLTVTDSNPADMCAGGLCAADFTIGFDPAALSFIPGSETSNFFVLAGAGASGEVQVSFVTLDAINFAGGPEALFTLGFNALLTQSVVVTIVPTDFGVPVLDQYLPAAANATVSVQGPAAQVPEPNTALLALLALAGLAWRRRTNLAQDQRLQPSV